MTYGIEGHSLLYSAMLAEERLYLTEGEPANGYVGPLGTPGAVTLKAVSASVAPAGPASGTTTLAASVFVVVAADAGDLQTPSGQMHQNPSTVATTDSLR